MGEFELIGRLFRPLAEATRQDGLLLGPGDDCAIQRVPPGHDLVFSVDTLVEGIHFPLQYDPALLGWRALAVAVSDLAAMGADPVCYTLALTLPEADETWVATLVSGLRKASQAFGIALAGGDITRGPLTLTVQVHGTVPEGQGIRRSGACPGDLVAITGPLGGAAAALEWLDAPRPPRSAGPFLDTYHHPVPQLDIGRRLRGIASAAIDISDGLVADLGHILCASGVGATLDMAAIPRQFGSAEATLDQALYGGDDYQLCLTLPAKALAALPDDLCQQLWVIGEVSIGAGQLLRYPDGTTESLAAASGYDHFKTE
jgi:thiamine-monophosphate kinase